MPSLGLQPMRDETPQTDYNKRLKHMRRVDMWRLLKHLGVQNIDVTMDGEKLRQIIQANNIDVFQYVDPDVLKFNPDSKALQDYMAKRRGVAAPKPTGEHLPPIPVKHGDEPIASIPEAAPKLTTMGHEEIDLDDMSAEGLKKLCLRRGLPFRQNESKSSLIMKLNGQNPA